MKIGVLGPIWIDIPPKGYGGTEEVVFNLLKGLVEKGHDVTLFGPKNSKVPSKLIPTVDIPLRSQNVEWTNIAYNVFHITAAFDRAAEFDILHVHLNKSQDYLALPLALYSPVPVVFTFHFCLPTDATFKDRYMVLMKYRNFPFTSISNSQRADFPSNFIKTVYNSLDLTHFPFSSKSEDYFAWLGKVNPLKGTKEAILAAKKANVKLIVMGAVDKGVPHMLEYYEKEVKPLIDGQQIVWRGEVSVKEKAEILGHAKAFLNPIQWEEPFGLVMVESMVVGTPVISMNRGAAPEIIVDGKTGFLVNSVDEMVEKMKQIDSINRAACRKQVEQNFTVEKMVTGYLDAYSIVVSSWPQIIQAQKTIIAEMTQ